MSLKDRGRRRPTLPRARPAPEHNIIQAPELIDRLSRRLGLRQSHITPALAEGVQAVILLEDLTARTHSSLPRFLAGISPPGGATPEKSTVIMLNPILSGRIIRLRKLRVHGTCDAAAASGVNFIVISLHTLIPPFVFPPPTNMLQVTGAFRPVNQDPNAAFVGGVESFIPPGAPVAQFWSGTAAGLAGVTHNPHRIGHVLTTALTGGTNFTFEFDDLILRSATPSTPTPGGITYSNYVAVQCVDVLAGSICDCSFEWTEEPADIRV